MNIVYTWQEQKLKLNCCQTSNISKRSTKQNLILNLDVSRI